MEQIIHGQTVVINTIIERKGVNVGLITTKGHRDVLELQRGNRRDMYNFKYKKPESIEPGHVIWLDDLTEEDLLELLQGPADTPGWGGWMGARARNSTNYLIRLRAREH